MRSLRPQRPVMRFLFDADLDEHSALRSDPLGICTVASVMLEMIRILSGEALVIPLKTSGRGKVVGKTPASKLPKGN